MRSGSRLPALLFFHLTIRDGFRETLMRGVSCQGLLPRPARPYHCGVDTRKDIREFLISRRAKITPELAGLPAFSRNRRVSGLRREEVAILAGISVEYYTRLERGSARGVSGDVLEGISRALQLDDAEHAHLFDLVRTANTTRSARRRATQGAGPPYRTAEFSTT